MSLWPVDSSQLKTIKAQQDSGRNFDLPPNCLKNLDRQTVPRTEESPELSAKNMGYVWSGEQGLEVRVHSVSHCLCLAQQTFIKPLPFHLHGNCLPPLWSPKPLPPTPSSVFSWRWYLRGGLQPCRQVFSWVSPMYTLLNFCLIFSC